MNFNDDVLNFKGKVLVDFNAEWCGPCQALKPILEEAEAELPEGTKIVPIDIDEHPEIAQEYGVASIPCLVLFEDGKEIDRQIGLVSKKKILKMLGA
ncbi:thioredoxin [Candidatus Saccharibacteria bacterium]|nr:thioredoxin [Candidatus Saccharibacteria bacterium]